MTDQEQQQSNSGAERRALNELIARFSADRDGLTGAVDRCHARLEELASTLVGLQSADGPTAADVGQTLDDWQAESERVAALARQTSEDLAALGSRLDDVAGEARHGRNELSSGIERVGELVGRVEAGQAELQGTVRALDEQVRTLLTVTDPDEAPWAEDVTRLGENLVALRDEQQRVMAEAKVHVDVRVESIVAGVEAQVASMRDGLWDRLAEVQQRLKAQEVAWVERVGTLDGPVERMRLETMGLRAELAEMDTRLMQTIETQETRLAQFSSGGVGALLSRAYQDVIAVVAGAVSLGVIIGRFATSAVLPRAAR